MRRSRRTALLLLAAVVVAGAVPAAAQAMLTYQTGQLHPWVWTANDDASGAHRLVRGSSPHIAPDGGTIVYSAGMFGKHPRLAAVPAAGGRSRTLLTRLRFGAFAYSPDSRWVVAVAGPELGNQRLVLVEVATGARRVLAHGVFSGASFSPDSQRVVYDRAGYANRGLARPDLYVTSVAPGGSARRLTHDGRSSQPVWGPRRIVYTRWRTADPRRLAHEGLRANLWLVAPDGSGRRQLTHDRVPYLMFGLVPTAWSADGSRLLAQFGGQDTTYAKTVNPVTGHERAVGHAVENGIVGTALSRDGSTILGYRGGFDPSTRPSVVTVPYGGGRPHVLVRNASEPSWTR